MRASRRSSQTQLGTKPKSDKVLRRVAGRQRIVVIVQPLAGLDGALGEEQHARGAANQEARRANVDLRGAIGRREGLKGQGHT